MLRFSTPLQTLGRTLMLPIAVLPVAALILRLGQSDLLDLPFLSAAGSAIFANLGLLFAVGIAIGLAREANGAAGLAGVVAYLVATNGAEALVEVPATIGRGLDAATQALVVADFRAKSIGKLGVPIGILSGIVAGLLYNRFSTIKVPEFLAFFGGRRFVPILAGLAGVGLALLFGLGWPIFASAIDGLSALVVKAGAFGLFVYGVLNRILIVTGLHHILNNVGWFIVGEYNGATGDLNRFFAGDPSAGGFMSGFFPVMMFGLPAACLAMYRAARPDQRTAVGGMYLSLALTSFLTGVTEPIEFTFMFIAPALYVLHALLTGIAMALMDLLGAKLGFGFSAGLFDYVLNFGQSTRPLLLLPVGAAYALIYYVVFSAAIRLLDLKTPGREAPSPAEPTLFVPGDSRGSRFVSALGGRGNLLGVEACTTRLRLMLVDAAAVDETALKQLGARGVIKVGPGALQVVLGPIADEIANEMRGAIAVEKGAVSATTTAPGLVEMERLPPEVVEHLGGQANIAAITPSRDRLIVTLRDAVLLPPTLLTGGGVMCAISERSIHLLRVK